MRFEMQHQGGLKIAAMDAVGAFLRRIQALGLAKIAPLAFHHHHPGLHPQLAAQDRDQVQIAAVGIDDHHFFQARPRHRQPDLGPGIKRGFGRIGQRAFGVDMLVGFADGLHRQDQNVDVLRAGGAQMGEHAFVDVLINTHRQVRPVLFHGGSGQDDDGFFRVHVGKFRSAELGPVVSFFCKTAHLMSFGV